VNTEAEREIARLIDHIWLTPGHGFSTLSSALCRIALNYPEQVLSALRAAVESEA
jgi:hypothetical protein